MSDLMKIGEVLPQTPEEAHDRALQCGVLGDLSRIVYGDTLNWMEREGRWPDRETFERFQDYCHAPLEGGGLGLNTNTRQAYQRVSRRWREDLGFSVRELMRARWSNLHMLTGVVKPKNAQEALEAAVECSPAQLREKLSAGFLRGEEKVRTEKNERPPSTVKKQVSCSECSAVFEVEIEV